MSIQAVKGVEIGDGFEVAGRRGSEAHDAIRWDAEASDYRRESHARRRHRGRHVDRRAARRPGGDEAAGHAQPADARRPSTSSPRRRRCRFKERTDVTAVPAMGVVAETMVALVLAAEAQRKFGGDSRRRVRPQRRRLPRHRCAERRR